MGATSILTYRSMHRKKLSRMSPDALESLIQSFGECRRVLYPGGCIGSHMLELACREETTADQYVSNETVFVQIGRAHV